MKNVINIGPKVMGLVLFIVLLLMITASPGTMKEGNGDYELTWYSFGGAIGKTSGGSFELNGGSGWLIPGVVSGGNYTLTIFITDDIDIRPKVTRLSGDNRYMTAVEISKSGWASADTVVLARGDEYADALAGVPLACRLDAPILLTPTASLHGATKTEIERLGAGEVILLGGTVAISGSVKDELEGMGLTVERIAGENRYETAVEVAQRLAEKVDYDTAFIAVGTNFADALAASSYAAMRGEPILLTGGESLSAATSNAITDLGIENTYVCGGAAAVSSAVFSELPNPTRKSGENRYETGLALAEEFLPEGANHIGIATGQDFPDAVAGGVWAAKNNTGILLVNGENSKPGHKVEEFLDNKGITEVTLFGGPGAVNGEMEDWFGDFFNLIQGISILRW